MGECVCVEVGREILTQDVSLVGTPKTLIMVGLKNCNSMSSTLICTLGVFRSNF